MLYLGIFWLVTSCYHLIKVQFVNCCVFDCVYVFGHVSRFVLFIYGKKSLHRYAVANLQ